MSEAGRRTEPAVSEPSAIKAEPSRNDTPAPELEPPGTRWWLSSQGLRGVPQWALRPTPPKANSTVWVFPVMTAFSSRRHATIGPAACHFAGNSRAEPANVGKPGMP